MNLSNRNYNFSTAFNPELALAGEVCALRVDNPDYIEGGDEPEFLYKLIESVVKKSQSYSTAYPYRVLVESVYYDLSNLGTCVEGYTAFMAKGIIRSVGRTKGNGVTVDQESYYLTDLNFREKVAIQVLNALLTKLESPLSCNDAIIALYITKSFNFAVEFVNQAIELRKANGTEVEGEVVPVEPTDSTEAIAELAKALIGVTTDTHLVNYNTDNISTRLLNLRKSITGVDPENPDDPVDYSTVNVLNKMDTANTKLENLKKSIIGDSGTPDYGTINISSKLTNINTNIGTVGTKIDTVNTNLSSINTNLGNIDDTIEAGDNNIAGALVDQTMTNPEPLGSTLEEIKTSIASIDNKMS